MKTWIAAAALVAVAPAFGIAPARAAGQSYGAIFYSASADAEGMAWSATSEDQAEALALKECRNNSGGAKDCKFQLRFHAHACGAFASDSKNFGFGRADDSAGALAQATSGLNANDSNFVSLVHCNADKAADAVADAGSTQGGPLKGSAVPAGTATAPPQAPNTQYFATPVPEPAASSRPSAALSTSQPAVEQTQRFALVGLKVYPGDVIQSIVPMYAPLGAGNTLGAIVDAPMLGNQSPSGSPVIISAPGSVITEVSISNSTFDGISAAYRVDVVFSPLAASGVGPPSATPLAVSGTAKPASLTVKEDLKTSPGQYFVKFNVTPVLAGSTYVVGDISVDQQQL